MKVVQPDADGLDDAARALRDGNIVAYPTETVYGLGVDPFNQAALQALLRAKGRPEGKPVLVIVADVEQLKSLVHPLPPEAKPYVDAFWPGPLSLLLPANAAAPPSILNAEGLVCVRCPGCAIARQLCQRFGGPITSTSANLHGAPPADRIDRIDVNNVAVAVDGGILKESRPSTLYNPSTAEILREGAIPANELRRIADSALHK